MECNIAEEFDDLFCSQNKMCCTKNCVLKFTEENLKALHNNVSGLDKESKDAFLSGCLTSTRSIGAQSGVRQSTNRPSEVRPSNKYFIRNISVCRKLFCLTYGISLKTARRLTNTTEQLLTNEFVDFGEKRGGMRFSHLISHGQPKEAIEFLDATANVYGLPDPGRHRSSVSYGVCVSLPHCFRKGKLYEMYQSRSEERGLESVSYKSFKKLWNETVSGIKVLPLRSDMCSTCSRLQNLLTLRLKEGNHSASSSSETVENVIESLSSHRTKAKQAREFYFECQQRAKLAYKNRTNISGKDYVILLVLSIDFAQSTDVPNRTDQDGQLYFLSPLTVGLFGVTDEGADEHATFLMPEIRTMKKNGNSVACMVLHFLERRKCFFDELIIFADNASSQNKNQFVISALSMMSVQKMFRCSSIRLSFMVVGHTKFRPDSWFGILKRTLLHRNIDCILDIEEAILDTGKREGARALGMPGHSHVPMWTHCPFTEAQIAPSVNFSDLISNFCVPLQGHSLWYDVEFTEQGSAMWRGAPCGNLSESDGHRWISVQIFRDAPVVRHVDWKLFTSANEEAITEERQTYLRQKVRPFVFIGGKTYARYTSRGTVNFRKFLTGNMIESDTSEDEFENIQEQLEGPTIVRSLVRTMGRKRLIEEIVSREPSLSVDDLKNTKLYSTIALRNILYRHATPAKKVKRS